MLQKKKCENAQAEDPPRSPTQPIHGEGGRGIDKLTGRGKEEEVEGERIYIISIVQHSLCSEALEQGRRSKRW